MPQMNHKLKSLLPFSVMWDSSLFPMFLMYIYNFMT